MPEEEQDLSLSDPAHAATHSGTSTRLGSVVTDVGVRIQEMLDAAERVAGDIRRDAEAAGEEYLQKRQREADEVVRQRINELETITQSLAARATGMEREASAFVAEVEQVRWRLARLIGDDDPPKSEPIVSAPRNGAGHWPESTGREASQAAALRATQMAVAGAERSEIERMLRDEFDIDDPSALDLVLGTQRP